MKILITENQFKTIIVELNNVQDMDDYFELMNEMIYNVFSSIKAQKKITFNKINPIQYKNALIEFMKYGTFMRFPAKIIYNWKMIMLRNTMLLNIMNDIFGHSQGGFPFDEFYDTFEISEEQQDYNWNTAIEILYDEYDIEEFTPKFSNGHELISDYGLEPLIKLAVILIDQKEPNQIIITINKMLDISHQRSDLSELFIEGGGGALDMISNS